jgi:hypothetical protein
MKYVCMDCGGSNVFEIGIKPDENTLDIDALNPDTALEVSEMPYYVGGYYCKDCQSFVSVVANISDQKTKPVTPKQIEYIKKLNKKLGKTVSERQISSLTCDHARRLIWGLNREWERKNPNSQKKDIPAATDKQKKFIVSKYAEEGKPVTFDVDTLNIAQAKKIISEIKTEKA